MSTIKTDTLQNVAGTQSVPVATVAQGSAKAWVNFNGTTSPGTIRASFNVSSVTRNSTGDYSVNLTTAVPDANGAPYFGGQYINNTTTYTQTWGHNVFMQSATVVRCLWNYDSANAYVIVFR
jgi:hypothetical protein